MTGAVEDVIFQRCREVAAIIDASQTSPALAAHLKNLVAGLRVSLTAESHYPRRRDLRDRLMKIGTAAGVLHDALMDETYYALLTKTSTGWLDLPVGFTDTLAAIRVAATTKFGEVPRGQGQQKAFPSPHALSAKCQCALIVSEAWKQIHGRDPNPDASGVHDAADLFWQTCGGRSIGEARATTVADSWRPYFREVLQRNDAYFIRCRQVISDQLTSPMPGPD